MTKKPSPLRPDSPHGADRRSLLRALFAVGFGSLISPVSSLGAFAMSVTPRQGAQTIEGNVFVNGKPAKFGTTLGDGDTVTTGAKGKAIFVAGRDVFLIRESSEIRFDHLASSDNATPGNEEKSLAVRAFTVVAGAALAVFGPGEKRIDTRLVTIGIRGSGAYIETGQGRDYFCLCYGTAQLVSKHQPEATASINTTHHESPFWIRETSNGNAFEKAPVINHTDAELIGLEHLVFRRPPFADDPGADSY
ncbi:MAG: hypothetical protein OQK23_09550 [Rhodospirillales bacterium]|nr:hypothetical protein [Rhodospirillales bacterium]MCW8971489.1 hypothetical protein [Rhodospirillales bacterium]